ncbi:hypothetical protein FRC07_011118, partial [Ceratobasidium sp. 392]
KDNPHQKKLEHLETQSKLMNASSLASNIHCSRMVFESQTRLIRALPLDLNLTPE